MRSHLAVAPLFAILAVAITWPLAWHLGTHVPGEVAGDNLSCLWNFWWMRQALASPERDFFQTTFLFHPVGVDLVQHTHTALNAWIGATLLAGTSIVAAQNLVLLGALTLAGLGAYLLAWDTTGHRGAAVLAGIIFAAAPFVPARLLGHFNLVSAWGLPVFAFLWLRALRTSSSRGMSAAIAWTAIAGIVLAAVAYTDYYYLIYLLVFVPCVIAVRAVTMSWTRSTAAWTWIDWTLVVLLALVLIVIIAIEATGGFVAELGGLRVSMRGSLNLRSVAWVLVLIGVWRRTRPRVTVSRREGATVGRDLLLTGVLLIVFAIGVAPLLLRAIDVWQRGEYVSLDIRWRSAPAGIDPLAVLFGNPFHPILGRAVRVLYDLFSIDVMERVAWFGLVPMVLLVAARRQWLQHASAWLWIVVGSVFFVWALGPYLRVGGHSGLWLPASLLQYVPVLSNARIPSRALVMVFLAVAVLTAIAVASRQHAWRPRTIAALCALVLIDVTAIPLPLYELQTSPLFERLATMPEGAVCVLPVGLRDGIGERGCFEHRALYDQSIHGKPIVGGFIARLPQRVMRAYEEAPILASLLRLSAGESLRDDELTRDRATAGEYLRGIGVRYVVLHRTAAPRQLLDYVASVLPVRLVQADGDLELYRVE